VSTVHERFFYELRNRLQIENRKLLQAKDLRLLVFFDIVESMNTEKILKLLEQASQQIETARSMIEAESVRPWVRVLHYG